MTETDVESLEKVPAPVEEAFMSSTMTGMRLRDIRIITFPKHPTVLIIEKESGINLSSKFCYIEAL